jgi:hypothetical protein
MVQIDTVAYLTQTIQNFIVNDIVGDFVVPLFSYIDD